MGMSLESGGKGQTLRKVLEVSLFVRLWKRQKVRGAKQNIQLQFHSAFFPFLALHCYFHHLLELDKSLRLICQARCYHCQALGEKANEVQRGRVKT